MQVLQAQDVIVNKLTERHNGGLGRTIISPDLSSFIAELDLVEFDDAVIRKAISALHRSGKINCGHPKREEFEVTPGGPRAYKITLN